MSREHEARRWLLPLVPAYRLALLWRERRLSSGAEPVRRLGWPVISIGNLSTGGAGKTPLTIALARLLTARGLHVDVLSRGYGREERGPMRVDPAGTFAAFGDEPLMIARQAGVPVYVARRRFDAGLLAEADCRAAQVLGEEARAAVHLLDDGFQHRRLARDIDIVLLDRRDLNDALLPAGNLREPMRSLRRATIVAVPASEPDLEHELLRAGSAGTEDRNAGAPHWTGPVWRLARRMDVPPVDGPVAAFCGIARAEQFFAGLTAAGMNLVVKQAFPDHHPYSRAELKRLLTKARAAGAAAAVTTEKDRVRLTPLIGDLKDALPVLRAGLRVEIEDEEARLEWLMKRLRSFRVDSTL